MFYISHSTKLLLKQNVNVIVFDVLGLQEVVSQDFPRVPGQPGREGRHLALPDRAIPSTWPSFRSSASTFHHMDARAHGRSFHCQGLYFILRAVWIRLQSNLEC